MEEREKVAKKVQYLAMLSSILLDCNSEYESAVHYDTYVNCPPSPICQARVLGTLCFLQRNVCDQRGRRARGMVTSPTHG